ncbi:MAG: hypothetical protein EA363_00725 [Balneolaceae bacterium]|nr:MAG: hypothetical protein EA363_00725 [Balneolaceae bacterium]
MKILYIIAGSIIAIFVILLLVVMISINSIVKSGIEETGTEMTGTAVTVESVSISPFSGKGTITGFRVANPDNYQQAYAFQVDEFSIELKPLSIFSSEVMVQEVIVTSPQIYVEQKLPENNINTILQHVRSISAGETTDKMLVIDYFSMTDGSVDLYTEVGGERSERVEISSIELHDLGRGEGQQALEEVIKKIAEDIAEEALRGALQSGGEQIRNAIRDLFD